MLTFPTPARPLFISMVQTLAVVHDLESHRKISALVLGIAASIPEEFWEKQLKPRKDNDEQKSIIYGNSGWFSFYEALGEMATTGCKYWYDEFQRDKPNWLLDFERWKKRQADYLP